MKTNVCYFLQTWVGDGGEAGYNENQPFQGQGVPPKFSQQLKSVIANEGQDAIFQCQITGTPRPRVTFKKVVIAKSNALMLQCESVLDPVVKKQCTVGSVAKNYH